MFAVQYENKFLTNIHQYTGKNVFEALRFLELELIRSCKFKYGWQMAHKKFFLFASSGQVSLLCCILIILTLYCNIIYMAQDVSGYNCFEGGFTECTLNTSHLILKLLKRFIPHPSSEMKHKHARLRTRNNI